MIQFAALLRGVNVGKDRRLPMAGLRALLTQMGYADAATLLNSGNVVFSAAKGAPALHAAAIAAAVAREWDVDVPVVVKSASEFAGIVARNPLAGSGLRDRTAAGVLPPRVVGSKLAADQLPASIR